MPEDRPFDPDVVRRLERQQRLEAQRLADEHARQVERAVPAAKHELRQRQETERLELAERHARQLQELSARGDLPRSDKAVDEFNKAVSSREMERAHDDRHAEEDRQRREAERARELQERYRNSHRDRGKEFDR